MSVDRGDGGDEIEQFLTKGHGRAGHHGMFDQNFQRTTLRKPALFTRSNEMEFQGVARVAGIFVDQIGIAESASPN